MEELKLGAYSLPLVVSLLLRWIYSIVNPNAISTRMKQIIPIVLGVGMSYLYMCYSGMAWSIVNIVDSTLYGIISLGLSAIGFYETTRKTG